MYYVYVLTNKSGKYYVGYTNNLTRRVREHEENISTFTRNKKFSLYMYIALPDKDLAKSFEMYLKTGSGRAFSKRHFEFKFDEALA